MAPPIIGVLLDWQKTGSFSKHPHYALRQHYFDAITACGGTPIGLAYDATSTDRYLDLIDGLLCPGGNYACPKDWYIDNDGSPYDESPRALLEVDFIRQTLARGKPVLGICGGMQVLGAAFGCKLTPNLHTHFDTDIDHKRGTDASGFAFNVKIEKNTQLFDLTKETEISVNSAHQEAIVTTPPEVIVTATAPDDTIQGIEIPKYPFAIGVQWHPEFFIKDDKGAPAHRKIVKAFITASINTKKVTTQSA